MLRAATTAAFPLLLVTLLRAGVAAQAAADPPDLVVFVGEGCPHCARALVWVDGLRARAPHLTVRVHDVVHDRTALERLRALADSLGSSGVSVPTFLVRGRTLVVGFGDAATTGRRIEALLQGTAAARAPPLTVPLLGEVRPEGLGLPLFTIVVALVDGFNPCAMWVLLFLLSILVHVRSRARMAVIGGVFVLASGAVYYAFMAAWMNAFALLGMARWIQVGLGGLAIALGALNTKDFLWLGRGPSLAIPERAKPGIYARVRRVLEARDMAGALGTVVVLALLVNTVELLCTAGLPALYTRVLTMQELPLWAYYAYLGLYIVVYMIDDAMILAVAVITLGDQRLRAGQARWLKLVSGLHMLALGLVLLFRPEWLTRL